VSKGRGPDAKHSPPATAEVKNEWHCISAPVYAFVACKGTKS